MEAGKDDDPGRAPRQPEPVAQRVARLVAVEGDRRPGIGPSVLHGDVVEHDQPVHHRGVERRRPRQRRLREGHAPGYHPAEVGKRLAGDLVFVAREELAEHDRRVGRRARPAPVGHRQRRGRRVADSEPGDQGAHLAVHVDQQRLERQVPQDAVGHDRQLRETGREVGAGARQEVGQHLLAGLFPFGVFEVFQGQLAVLLVVAHRAQQVGDFLGELGRSLHLPVAILVLVEQKRVQVARRGEKRQQHVPRGEGILDFFGGPDGRKHEFGGLAAHGDLAQKRLLVRADRSQRRQVILDLAEGIAPFGNQRQGGSGGEELARLARQFPVSRVLGEQVLAVQPGLLAEKPVGRLEDPPKRLEPPAVGQRAVEAMPSGAVGDFEGLFEFPSSPGDAKPVLERPGVRRAQDGQGLHRLHRPVGGLRVAEQFRVELHGGAGRDRGSRVDLPGGERPIELGQVVQPVRAVLHVAHGGGQGLVALGHLALLEEDGRPEVVQPGAVAAQGHGAATHRGGGVIEHVRRLAGLPQHRQVLGGREPQRGAQAPKVLPLGPLRGRFQGREDARAVRGQVRHGPVAERFFEDPAVVEVVGGYGRLVEMRRGLSEVALREVKLPQLQKGRGGQRMIVLPRGDDRPVQHGDRLGFAAGGDQGQTELDVDPGLRPVVGRARARGKGRHQVGRHRVPAAQRAHQLGPPPDGQRGAADDLLDLDRKHLGRHHRAAPPDRGVDVDLPLAHEHRFRVLTAYRLPVARAPGAGPLAQFARGADGGREIDPHHPVGKGQVEGQGVVVMALGLVQLAHVVVALADHRVIADRVDPAALRRLDSAAPFIHEQVAGVLVFALVEGIESRMVRNRRNRAHLLGLRPRRRRPQHHPARHQQREPNAGAPAGAAAKHRLGTHVLLLLCFGPHLPLRSPPARLARGTAG